MARLAYTRVSPRLLLAVAGLPDSMEILSPKDVRFLLQGPELDDIPQGADIPEVQLILTSREENAPRLVVHRVEAIYPETPGRAHHTVVLKDVPPEIQAAVLDAGL